MFLRRLLACSRVPFRLSRLRAPAPLFFSTKPSAASSTEINAIKEALQAASKAPSTAPKLLIGFTCKCCNTRTHHVMSRHAYEKGIVLIECPGCEKRHLIADNLGWFKDTPQAARRIEDMKDVGEIRRELRLSEDDANELLQVLKKTSGPCE